MPRFLEEGIQVSRYLGKNLVADPTERLATEDQSQIENVRILGLYEQVRLTEPVTSRY